jgi:UDPglucose--hexose-1-phosphate uridylyltransferase
MADEPYMTWGPVEEEWILRVPGRLGLAPRADLAPDDPRDRICPFCPGGAEAVVGAVRAVPSKHPMVAQSNDNRTRQSRHWVLTYGESHDRRLGDLPLPVTVEFIEVVAVKTKQLFKVGDVQSVFAFESVGDHFGPTVAHPHGQLVGLPFIPRRLTLTNVDCQLCSPHMPEDLKIQRIGAATLGVSPWSRLPFEMLTYPEAHHSSLMSMNSSEKQDLAKGIHTALNLAIATHGGRRPPYLINIMQAARGDTLHHFRVEIIPLHKDTESLKRPGGMELSLGVYLNPVTPNDAATLLRQALEGIHA